MKEEKPGPIAKFFDKAYETKNVWELAKAPMSAISGVTESDAKDLKKAFGIETVEDLANNRYVNLAQGINFLSLVLERFWTKSANQRNSKTLLRNLCLQSLGSQKEMLLFSRRLLE